MKVLFIILNLFMVYLYGMNPVVASLITDYQSLRKAYVEKYADERKQIAPNIFVEHLTPNKKCLNSQNLTFGLYCQQKEYTREEVSKKFEEYNVKFFFFDNPLLDKEAFLEEAVGLDGTFRMIDHRDTHLFYYDVFAPAVHTNLIEKDVVKKDRDCIEAFLINVKIMEKKLNRRLPRPLVCSLIIPRLCSNIQHTIKSSFKQVEAQTKSLLAEGKEINEGKEKQECLFNFFRNLDKDFAMKADFFLSNFNFSMVQEIIRYHFNRINFSRNKMESFDN